MEGDRAKGAVCVTGGTGYIASWLIMRLLQRGYAVQATVRSSSPEGKKKDISFLESLPGAAENLRTFTADLDDPESFTEAIEGCSGVFHLAMPMDGEPDQSAMNRQAIDATLGILRASLKSKTVKRVMYTSSVAAVIGGARGTELLDESSWTDVDHVVAMEADQPYIIAKTLAEKQALEFGEANGLDVLTIIPPWVAGPFICNKLPDSIENVLAMVFGKEEHYAHLHHMPLVHVDDLASAYIFLFEHPSPKGRYICCLEHLLTPEKMIGFLSEKYPHQFSLPSLDKVNESKYMYARLPRLSSKKLLDSSFKFKYGLEEIIDESIRCCRDKGYL